MKFRYRLLSVLLAACAFIFVLYTVYGGVSASLAGDGEGASLFRSDRTTIKLWYDDEALTDYLKKEAVVFNETSGNIRLEPVYVSGVEYLETIAEASVAGEDFPDLFLLTNDALEKAYLAGLTTEVDVPETITESEQYSSAAVNAVTYNGKVVAYPYYMDTSALVYNENYLEEYARSMLEAEVDAALGEEATAAIEDGSLDPSAEDEEGTDAVEYAISDEEVQAEMDALLPSTINDILVFAENYNAPNEVEAVFKWDVSDLFFDYFIVGDYMNLGGACGDDPSQLDLYNTDAIACMRVFSSLNQFFAIDAEDADYDSLMQDLLDGKIVFTLATTDILKTISDAQTEGTTTYSFGVTTMPALTTDYGTRPLSVTDALCVNGYSEHAGAANQVARFLINQSQEDLWRQTGKVSARSAVFGEENANMCAFQDVYASSVPMPKMIATSNFWVQMEITFAQIWNGADPNVQLKALAEQILTQVSLESVTLDKLPDPEEVSIVVEEEDVATP